MTGSRLQSNFTHLKAHDEQLVRLGLLAERYFAEDPNTCLIKLRQLTELLAQLVASQIGSRVWVWTLDGDLAGLDRLALRR